jgi:glucose-6-phosphate isomerase
MNEQYDVTDLKDNLMKVNSLDSWLSLERQAQELKTLRIESLFRDEPARLNYLSLEVAGLYVDFSKNLITKNVFNQLVSLAKERQLVHAIKTMFRGDVVNTTEDRPALHSLLRAQNVEPGDQLQSSRFESVIRARRQMGAFCNRVRNGELVGYSGTVIRDVVSIGIGGSHLGPQLVCDALRYEQGAEVNVHFVANVDGGDIDRVLAKLNPESTYFIVASKSFSTTETLLNARTARTWIQSHFSEPQATESHFSAVTAMPDRAKAFGIGDDNVFPMWDWVGGRYSLWSTIGLPIAIAVGIDRFERLLAGARQMDEHFQHTELRYNLPVALALVAIWNNNFLGCRNLAIVPYDDRLNRLPNYLQQLEMESNGKRVTLDGEIAEYATAPVIWGGVGTNAQHAFFQHLHQGAEPSAVEFIMALTHQRASQEHQDMLVANCIAQAEGLMRGTSSTQSPAATSPTALGDLSAHRQSPGNRPSTMVVMDAITPETIGALLALYEHKTFVQGVIWNINPFDQYGVELGKNLADTILEDLGRGELGSHDRSTAALLTRYQRLRN